MNAYLASNADNTAGVIVAWVFSIIAIAGYWVPTVVVLLRRAPNRWQVIVVNVFLGWTVIGWIVALVMAVKPKPPPVPAWYDHGGYLPPGQPINYRPQ